jgi:hypothetical protein
MMERLKVVGGSHDSGYASIDRGRKDVVLQRTMPSIVTSFVPPDMIDASMTVIHEHYTRRTICVPSFPGDRKPTELCFLALAEWDDLRAISNLIAGY